MEAAGSGRWAKGVVHKVQSRRSASTFTRRNVAFLGESVDEQYCSECAVFS